MPSSKSFGVHKSNSQASLPKHNHYMLPFLKNGLMDDHTRDLMKKQNNSKGDLAYLDKFEVNPAYRERMTGQVKKVNYKQKKLLLQKQQLDSQVVLINNSSPQWLQSSIPAKNKVVMKHGLGLADVHIKNLSPDTKDLMKMQFSDQSYENIKLTNTMETKMKDLKGDKLKMPNLNISHMDFYDNIKPINNQHASYKFKLAKDLTQKTDLNPQFLSYNYGDRHGEYKFSSVSKNNTIQNSNETSQREGQSAPINKLKGNKTRRILRQQMLQRYEFNKQAGGRNKDIRKKGLNQSIQSKGSNISAERLQVLIDKRNARKLRYQTSKSPDQNKSQKNIKKFNQTELIDSPVIKAFGKKQPRSINKFQFRPPSIDNYETVEGNYVFDQNSSVYGSQSKLKVNALRTSMIYESKRSMTSSNSATVFSPQQNKINKLSSIGAEIKIDQNNYPYDLEFRKLNEDQIRLNNTYLTTKARKLKK